MTYKNQNPGDALAGAIKAKCSRQDVFVAMLNDALAKRGSNKSFQTSVVSNWCQLNQTVLDAMSDVLGQDVRKFFS